MGRTIEHAPSRREQPRRAVSNCEPNAPLLGVTGLTVSFRTRHGIAHAVRHVDLSVQPGQLVGIAGESGCGKSVTTLAIVGLVDQRAEVGGSFHWCGRDVSSQHARQQLCGRGIGIIFQDPGSALNPVQTVGRQIAEVLHFHRDMTWRRAKEEAVELLGTVGISNARLRARQHPHELSGGMKQRAMIAAALAGEPQLLICDEATTGLDVTVQAQIIELLLRLRRERSLAMIFVSHDLGVMAQLDLRLAVMYAGKVVEEGPVSEVLSAPHHPYTRGLLESSLSVEEDRQRLHSIPGSPPTSFDVPTGCAFRSRCPLASQACLAEPDETDVRPNWRVRCWHSGDLR